MWRNTLNHSSPLCWKQGQWFLLWSFSCCTLKMQLSTSFISDLNFTYRQWEVVLISACTTLQQSVVLLSCFSDFVNETFQPRRWKLLSLNMASSPSCSWGRTLCRWLQAVSNSWASKHKLQQNMSACPRCEDSVSKHMDSNRQYMFTTGWVFKWL